MAHLALYRTYRPQNFDAVVGQKHIVQTVKNQVKNDLLAHAYMLTGPRGTGKTSIARIVAKAINCPNSENGNPCNSCESCLAVSKGNHPDVFELDGASNNGVEEIRDIRERVKYSPSLSPYKVYIIDEVHMLSTGAFNALLKTLEEPPQHVIFMLATTEIHKVPDTILSRTQRFDLKQIPSGDMTVHLRRILDELGVGFETGVPELVAKIAAGGVRDALSLLDQAIAYTSDIVKISDIHDLSGSVDADALARIIEHVITEDFAQIVESTRDLLSRGKLPARIIDGLLRMLRDILKVQKVGGEDPTGLSGKLNSEQVLVFIKKLNNLGHDLKIATDAELILEVGLLELGFVKNNPLRQKEGAGMTSANDYNGEIMVLKGQICELQAEVAELRNLKMKGRSTRTPAVGEIPPPPPPMVSDFPVFVQGELMNSVSFENVVDGHVVAKAESGELLIENILAAATKQDKLELQGKIGLANPFAKLDIKEIVMLLKDAEIAAASPAACILVYDYETTAQKLLTEKGRENAQKVLTDLMERSYEFLALPKDFWLAQRASYVAQKKQGVVPVLEQYPQSVDLKASESTILVQEVPFYQEIVDMFGALVVINE